MDIDAELTQALQAMLFALPNQDSWSGAAARLFEQRLREQMTILIEIRAGLWR